MKIIISAITGVMIFATGIAVQRYILSRASKAERWLATPEYLYPSVYSNASIKFAGVATTAQEINQDDTLLEGGMFLTKVPNPEIVLAFQSGWDTMSQELQASITELYRTAHANADSHLVSTKQDTWIVGRIPGEAGGSPRVWHSFAHNLRDFYTTDGLYSCRIDVFLMGPDSDSLVLPGGHYFLLRLTDVSPGHHKVEVWPTYHWEGGYAGNERLPTQSRISIEFDVED